MNIICVLCISSDDDDGLLDVDKCNRRPHDDHEYSDNDREYDNREYDDHKYDDREYNDHEYNDREYNNGQYSDGQYDDTIDANDHDPTGKYDSGEYDSHTQMTIKMTIAFVSSRQVIQPRLKRDWMKDGRRMMWLTRIRTRACCSLCVV